MLTIKKILFPTDFSRSANHALVQALYLAERHNAVLHLFHVAGQYDDPNNPSYHFPTPEEMLRIVQNLATAELANEYSLERLQQLLFIQRQERSIVAAPAILEYASNNEIDLIVMGTHGRRGLGHILLGSVAEEVVRLSPCPVLTMRERKDGDKVQPVRRILVPVDFSGHARQALAHAKELARMYAAELQVLHVIEEVMHPAFYVSGRTSIFEFMPEVEKDSTKQIQHMLDEVMGPNLPAEIFLREGHPAQEIVTFAENRKSDLIVIATHGLTGIEHFLLGSVTEKVVRLALAPVFTVKGFGKSLVEGSFVDASNEFA